MLSLVTFNVRTPVVGDGVNYFPYRLKMITDRIRMERPDVIGFQELTQDSYEAMQALLPEYAFVGAGREVDLSGESTRVAYRPERFHLVVSDQFWLSPTPRVPGSRYEIQSKCPRVANLLRLYDRETREQFFFLNTHLDHRSDPAREQGLRQIFDYLAALNAGEDLRVFVTGDFNLQPDSPAYAMIAEYGYTDLTSALKDSYHGYGTCIGCKIDYILTNRPDRDFALSVWHEEKDGRFLSDHDAVCVKG